MRRLPVITNSMRAQQRSLSSIHTDCWPQSEEAFRGVKHVDDMGAGQFGQCSESTMALPRTGAAIRAYRCRHATWPHEGRRVSGDESERSRPNAGGWRLQSMGIQFALAIPVSRVLLVHQPP